MTLDTLYSNNCAFSTSTAYFTSFHNCIFTSWGLDYLQSIVSTNDDALLSITNKAKTKAMRINPLLLLLAMNIATISAKPLDLGNFQKTPWHGMQAVNGPCPVPLPPGLVPNTQVACWKDLPQNPTLFAPKMPEDLSA